MSVQGVQNECVTAQAQQQKQARTKHRTGHERRFKGLAHTMGKALSKSNIYYIMYT